MEQTAPSATTIRLGTIGIMTKENSPYIFPDMDLDIFDKMLLNEDTWQRLGSLAMSNISGACLVIPVRIIHTITVDGKVRWTVPPPPSAA